MRQLYLGRDVWDRRRGIFLRRSGLRSYAGKGSRYARQALRRLRERERNYVTARWWQVAHEVLKLAEEYNAFVAIEDLMHLNRARGDREGNRESKRMPYRKLQAVLRSLCGQQGRLLVAGDPRKTSVLCSRCGADGLRRGALFKCPSCGNVGERGS